MLSPEEIQSRQFQIGLRGYDVEEVRSFLARVAEAYRSALDEVQQHEDAALPRVTSNEQASSSQGTEAPSYESVGREVSVVLRSAREAAEQMKEQAHARATEMIEAAERKAFELQMQAQVRANEGMHELALSSQRIKDAEGRLREGLGQLEAVLAMTRFDLERAPGAHTPSPIPQPSPWRPVTAAAEGHDA